MCRCVPVRILSNFDLSKLLSSHLLTLPIPKLTRQVIWRNSHIIHSLPHTFIHTYTHTCIHAYAQTRTHTHTHCSYWEMTGLTLKMTRYTFTCQCSLKANKSLQSGNRQDTVPLEGQDRLKTSRPFT